MDRRFIYVVAILSLTVILNTLHNLWIEENMSGFYTMIGVEDLSAYMQQDKRCLHNLFIVKGTAQINPWFVKMMVQKFNVVLYMLALIIVTNVQAIRAVAFAYMMIAFLNVLEFMYFSETLDIKHHFIAWGLSISITMLIWRKNG